jgi:hypothetical protein
MPTLAVRGLRLVGLLAVLTVGGAGGWPLAVFADAAPPWEPGDAIGEPTGAVAHVAITHEDLAFDLRALADANPVQVRATYQLRNDAAPTSASLVFLADHALTGASRFAVTFDGAAVAATPTTLTQLPNAWKPPTSTPSLIDGADVPYDTKPGTAFQFTAFIPPGPHRLSVAYTVLPGRYSWAGSTTLWQVAYVLAPARQWASFGDLSVRAQLPPGWRSGGAALHQAAMGVRPVRADVGGPGGGPMDVHGVCYPAGHPVQRWKVRRRQHWLHPPSWRAPDRGYRGRGWRPRCGHSLVPRRGDLGPSAPARRPSRNRRLTGGRGRGSLPLDRLRGLLPPGGFLGIHGLIRSLYQLVE